MLGEKVCDPLHVESSNDAVEGLGLMPYVTTMQGFVCCSRCNIE